MKDDTLTTLVDNIVQWAEDRKILQNGNLSTQGLKLVSEIGELADNIAKGKDIRDDIGDSAVVLIIIAKLYGSSFEECLEVAYNDIKNRKGYLNENGVFIKNE